MPTRLIDCLVSTSSLSEIFSDRSVLRAMLNFEAALARSEASCGVIPASAAETITEVATAADFEIPELVRQSLRAGTPAIPVVNALTSSIHGDARNYVHWGATSQDVVDTAIVMLLVQCRDIFTKDHARLAGALRGLSDQHAQTVMLGRTLMQPAAPITFGLKAAAWLASLDRCWKRVTEAFEDARVLQFGGAAGTLAALGDRGLAVSEALAADLNLKCPNAPWHAHPDRLSALMSSLSIYSAAAGKMALDIALLMQFEVGEATEPGGDGRGGSSAMPHKHNATACMLAIAAAKRTPGLFANFLIASLQEHERALGGWQSEWNLIEGIVQSTGLALESMVEVVEGLTVNAARMRKNIDATNGTVFAEKAMIQLASKMGKDAARRAVEESLRTTDSPPDLPDLRNPEGYLGSAETFRKRLLDRK